MNALIIGSNTKPLLQFIPRDSFLLIDDEIDYVSARARMFDVSKHTFNPLKDMDYRTAIDFAAVFDAVFPGGENTLTKQNTNIQLIEALLDNPRTLSNLIKDTKDTHDAYVKVQRLLLSPVLERVLNHGTNFSMHGTILARLNRAELGDFDAFVLGNLLVSQYRGQVVIPDFGFYAIPSHVSLIRQNRLIAGITSFDRVPALRDELILIDRKEPSHCTPADAAILAQYRGLVPHTNEYNDFIAAAIA